MKFQEIYKNFITRIVEHSKIFLFSVIVAFWAGYTLTGNFIACLCIASLLVLIIIISIYKWNVFFIEMIEINNSDVFFKIYKYNTLVVNSFLKKTEIKCTIEIVSSSKRGNSYKLNIFIKDELYTQYETMGWTKLKFQQFLEEFNKTS